LGTELTTSIRKSNRRGEVQRVGGRWKPDTCAGGEWAWESPGGTAI